MSTLIPDGTGSVTPAEEIASLRRQLAHADSEWAAALKESNARKQRAAIAEAAASMAAHDRDEALVNLDAACMAARANAVELMQGTLDGLSAENKRLRDENHRLRNQVVAPETLDAMASAELEQRRRADLAEARVAELERRTA